MSDIKDLKMYKEIHETPKEILHILDMYTDGDEFKFDERLIEKLKGADQIIFIACGTSYHACRMGVDFFIRAGKMANAYIASEWAYNPVVYGKNPVFFLVSQSGETGDVLACKFYKNDTIVAVTNKKNSSIDKMAKYSVPLDCGEELGIAATKSFSTQYVVLYLLASAVQGRNAAIDEVRKTAEAVEKIFALEDEIASYADIFVPRNRAFILGRGIDYIAATEGSLKIKETSYMFAEPYASGEFKHGYIALVEFGVPVIGLLSSPSTAKIFRTNLDDVKSKGGNLVIISSKPLAKEGDQIVIPSVNQYIDPLLLIIVLQILAAHISHRKGINTDSPRSLVKSVKGE